MVVMVVMVVAIVMIAIDVATREGGCSDERDESS
jgi:hypothetical protein